MSYDRLSNAISECRDKKGRWNTLPFEVIEKELSHDYTDSERLNEFLEEIEFLKTFNGRYKQFEEDYSEMMSEAKSADISKKKLEEVFGSEVEEIVDEGIEASIVLLKLKSYQEQSSGEESKIWGLIFDTCLELVGPKVSGLAVDLGNLTPLDSNFKPLKKKYSGHDAVEFVFKRS